MTAPMKVARKPSKHSEKLDDKDREGLQRCLLLDSFSSLLNGEVRFTRASIELKTAAGIATTDLIDAAM